MGNKRVHREGLKNRRIFPQLKEKDIVNTIDATIKNNTFGIKDLYARNILANEILDALNEAGFIVVEEEKLDEVIATREKIHKLTDELIKEVEFLDVQLADKIKRIKSE